MSDVLIATDDRMREEIQLSEINPDVQKEYTQKKYPFYTQTQRKNQMSSDSFGKQKTTQNNWSRKIDTHWGYSSGPVALTLVPQQNTVIVSCRT